MAGPLTTGYRLRKFLRRHKALVGGIAAVMVVSVIGTIVSVTFAMGQAKALVENRTLTKFLNNDILIPLGHESFNPASIREIFDAASEKLTSEFADYPLREASVRYSFGRIYGWQFRDSDTAISNLKRAVELRKRETGIPPFDYMNYLALSCTAAGRYSEAEAIFSEIIESIEKERGQKGMQPGGLFYRAIKSHLGNTWRLMGRYDEAEPYIREAPVHPWWDEGHWREFLYRGRVAALLTDQGHYEQAGQLYEELLRNRRRSEDKRDAGIMKDLGILYTLDGKLAQAEPLLEKALEKIQGELHRDHLLIADYEIALAVLRTQQVQYAEAEMLFDRALSKMQATSDSDHPKVLRAKSHLGVLYREQERHDEAEKLLSEVIEGQSQKLGPDHPHTLQSMHELAVLYVKQDQHQQAAVLLAKVAEGRLVKLGDRHPHTQESLSLLIDLYKILDQPKEADKWRAKLPADGTTNGQSQNASGQ